jgi:hypothetical protein
VPGVADNRDKLPGPLECGVTLDGDHAVYQLGTSPSTAST